MKKLIAAITALMMLAITGQVFAHGSHSEDAVWVAFKFANLDTVDEGDPNGRLFKVPMPNSGYYHEDAYSISNMYFQNQLGHLHHVPKMWQMENWHGQEHQVSVDEVVILCEPGTNNHIQGGRDGHKYPFTVFMDGTVSPTDGLWDMHFGHPNPEYDPGHSQLYVGIRGLGKAYTDQNGTESGWRPVGGGPAGDDGADGAQGPQGDAGSDGASGDQGPQGKVGADGAAGAAGAAGADAPCTPCADVTDAAVALACEILGNSPPASVSELTATAGVIVNNLLISANICEDPCDINAGIQAALDAKLNP